MCVLLLLFASLTVTNTFLLENFSKIDNEFLKATRYTIHGEQLPEKERLK